MLIGVSNIYECLGKVKTIPLRAFQIQQTFWVTKRGHINLLTCYCFFKNGCDHYYTWRVNKWKNAPIGVNLMYPIGYIQFIHTAFFYVYIYEIHERNFTVGKIASLSVNMLNDHLENHHFNQQNFFQYHLVTIRHNLA